VGFFLKKFLELRLFSSPRKNGLENCFCTLSQQADSMNKFFLVLRCLGLWCTLEHQAAELMMRLKPLKIIIFMRTRQQNS
jgi:hypothetical protein